MTQRLELVPIFRDEALAFIAENHRHLGDEAQRRRGTGKARPPNYLFAIACAKAAIVCGVAIVARPKARHLQDGWTAEVVRLCTDGTRNASSFLYGAAWRAARELGYRKLVTYTLPEEGGASLRAAGWMLIGERGGGSWSRKERPRVDKHPTQRKLRWEAA